MTSPLAGVRILDLSETGQGLLATKMLAEMGADVVKVERAGEPRRGSPVDLGEPAPSSWEIAVESGKRSIAVEPGSPRAAELVLSQMIVDAGPEAVKGFWSSSRGGSRTRGRGRRTGRRAFLAWCEARDLGLRGVSPLLRGGLHPDAPRVGPHGEAAPGRDRAATPAEPASSLALSLSSGE